MGGSEILFGQVPDAEKRPLILTVQLDAESAAFFNTQRIRYFPPGRNLLHAHLTLFHQLPNSAATVDFLKAVKQPRFDMQVTGLRSLGAGVAYQLHSPELNALRQSLSNHFHDWLIPQDLQGFRPHITIMNKSTPEIARTLLTELQATFQPFPITAIGLDVWTYLGGPWQHYTNISFS